MESDRLDYCQLTSTAIAIEYRDWKISVFQHEWDGPTLRIVGTLPNAYDPESTKTVDIGVDSAIPPMRSEADFLAFVCWRLIRIESHEVREFFRYRGKRIYDPHPELEKANKVYSSSGGYYYDPPQSGDQPNRGYANGYGPGGKTE